MNVRSDDGSASIVVVWTTVIIALFGAGGLLLGSLAISQTRASQAADLAALAGAERVWADPAAACAMADDIGTAHGATLVSCQTVGLDVQVVVTAPLAGPLSALGQARATARAGPPE